MANATTPQNATLLTAPQPGPAATGLLGGPSASRPAGPLVGQLYLDTTLGYEIVWNGTVWAPVVPPTPNYPTYTTTATRPLSPFNGQLNFNTTLGGLEAWNGTLWLFIGPGGSTTPTGPTIVTQPASLTVAAASSATFTVTASGTGSLTYQWYFNNVAISGATSNSYTIASAAQSNGGNYYVIVTSSTGSTQSATASLVVTGAPYITVQPTSQTVTATASVTFSVTATGTNPLTYQWYFNSGAIAGATGSTYTIGSTASTNAGNYYVIVSNGSGSATSNTVTLTVNAAPASFSCTSFTAICVASVSASAIIGYQYSNGGSMTTTIGAVTGNLPSGCTATAYTQGGTVITTATSNGSTPSITLTYSVTGTSASTVVFSTQSGTPIAVQFTATSTSTMLFTNCSVRATIYGPVLFPPYGLAMALTASGITPGSVCTAEFMDGASTTSFKSPPYFSWNFNGVTTSNPYVGFTPGTTLNITGSAGSSVASDSRLDINSGTGVG